MNDHGKFVDLCERRSQEVDWGSPRNKPSKEQHQKSTVNTVTILECSNACPFVQHYGMYRCFYCPEKYSGIVSLREHNTLEHAVPCAKPRLDTLHKGTFVMVDVTDLRCNLCNESTPDLYKLKAHLGTQHHKPLYHEASDGVIPFKLEGDILDCLVCGQQFLLFQLLTQHMNVHYGDKVCEICGAGFLSHGRLKSHKVIHKVRETGNFPCDSCDKVFNTELKRKRHHERVHQKKPRYRCPKCPENFTEYYIRITHMYNVHDIEPPEYRCELCGNGYRRPHLVALHMKKCAMRGSNTSTDVEVIIDDDGASESVDRKPEHVKKEH